MCEAGVETGQAARDQLATARKRMLHTVPDNHVTHLDACTGFVESKYPQAGIYFDIMLVKQISLLSFTLNI